MNTFFLILSSCCNVQYELQHQWKSLPRSTVYRWTYFDREPGLLENVVTDLVKIVFFVVVDEEKHFKGEHYR